MTIVDYKLYRWAIAASYKEASPLDLVKHKNNLITNFLSNNLSRIFQR